MSNPERGAAARSRNPDERPGPPGVLFLLLLAAFGVLALARPGPAAERDRGTKRRIAGEIDASRFTRLVAGEHGRVLLVNFWATWCGPCRAEFPDLSRLATTYRSRGFDVIGISTDFDSQRPAVEKFLAGQKPAFANYHKARGDDEAFINSVDPDWGGELPFTLIYDRRGHRVVTISGERTFEGYEKEIRPLLGSHEPR